MLVTNSNVKHELTGSEYPDRVRQCRTAVAILQQAYGSENIRALRDATMEMLEACRDHPDMTPLVYRRARHAIGEDRRTLAAVEALRVGDFESAGRFMVQSHVSLKEDFEVSCDELDLLVELAMEVEGVYGSRMTGGGFGGCTITLVKKSALATLREFLKTEYKARTGGDCDCYEAAPAAGSGSLDLATVGTKYSSGGLPGWLLPAAIGVLTISVAVAFLRKTSK